jgi:hypothetical protein
MGKGVEFGSWDDCIHEGARRRGAPDSEGGGITTETVRIANLKASYLRKFPDTVLAWIISQESDELSPLEFLEKTKIWIAILDSEEKIKERKELKI